LISHTLTGLRLLGFFWPTFYAPARDTLVSTYPITCYRYSITKPIYDSSLSSAAWHHTSLDSAERSEVLLPLLNVLRINLL